VQEQAAKVTVFRFQKEPSWICRYPINSQPANIMKRPSLAMASAIGLSCLTLGSCNPQDPSAARENQKMIAEATAKASKLEQENTDLKSQIEGLQKQVSDAASKANAETNTKKSVTDDALDQKLSAAVGKLRDQLTAMDKKIDSLKAETEKSIALNEDRARNNTAAANSAVAKTNPTPPQADRERAAQPPQVKIQPAPEPPKPKYDIKLDHPVMGPGGR